MNFYDKIKELRSHAQEAQAANKIIDMLNNLESKNDENTSYRWVWELIQNAKDVPNSSGKVDIEIVFNEVDGFLEFKHNGKFFTTKNIIFLIEQVSTKERDKIEKKIKKTTGKFGTGFLTTHLLSRKVNVCGYIDESSEKLRKFSVDLDRTSEVQQEIIESISNSCMQLEKESQEVSEAVNEYTMNTVFRYSLSQEGIDVAKKGLNNLIVSASYIFGFVPEINSITIDGIMRNSNFHQYIRRDSTFSVEMENAIIESVIVNTNGKDRKKYLFVLGENNNNIQIAFELNSHAKKVSVEKYHDKLPKLFCDFPLLGTEDFSFPVVINCKEFNPTEPRNGIFLTTKQDEKNEELKHIKENKTNILRAIELYKLALDYTLKKKYLGIYNIVKIIDLVPKEWISLDWYNENVITVIKNYIENQDLIETHGGNKCKICINQTDDFLLLPNHDDECIRTKLWTLLSFLYPNRVPKIDELNFWYESLWKECHNYSISDLVEDVENYSQLSVLKAALNCNATEWINNFYELLYLPQYQLINSIDHDPKIILNQNEVFCEKNVLKININIEEKYIELAKMLEIDLNERFAYDGISPIILKLLQIDKYCFNDLCEEMLSSMKYPFEKRMFHKEIVCLNSKYDQNCSKFISLLKQFYPDEKWEECKVKNTSDEIRRKAIEFWLYEIAEDISNMDDIEALIIQHNFINEEKAVSWLSKYINSIMQNDCLDIFNKKRVVLDQNNKFKKTNDLYNDTGKVSEETKDVCALIHKDIRSKLLRSNLGISISSNREIENEQIANGIISYIKERKNNLWSTDDERKIFTSFYQYINNQTANSEIRTIFADLLLNWQWFYNEKEIADSLIKVNAIDDVLAKHGINNISDLDRVLSFAASNSSASITISKEMLAEYGISSEQELRKLIESKILGSNFIYDPSHSPKSYTYVKEILERSKRRVLKHLSTLNDYNVDTITEVYKTIFLVKKNNEDIYIIARPSDYNKVVIYYPGELDILDYTKDCELWVENNVDTPEKLTFGKILKLTGVNTIPLTKVGKYDKY